MALAMMRWRSAGYAACSVDDHPSGPLEPPTWRSCVLCLHGNDARPRRPGSTSHEFGGPRRQACARLVRDGGVERVATIRALGRLGLRAGTPTLRRERRGGERQCDAREDWLEPAHARAEGARQGAREHCSDRVRAAVRRRRRNWLRRSG
eukprot:6214368-Pleurochrysis_carterae.AAC.4